MRRSEAKVALAAAREWESKGMFKSGAFPHIERQLAPIADEGSPSLAMQSFYAIGGIMLGAASAALYGLLELNNVLGDAESIAWYFFLIFAVLFGGIAVAMRMAGQDELGDALTIAALVPTAILLGPSPPSDVLYAIPVLAALGVILWRRDAHLLPVLGMGLLSVGLPIMWFQTMGEDWSFGDAATWMWLLSAAAVLGGVLTWGRMRELRWQLEGTVAGTLGVAASWIAVVAESIQPDFDGGYEVIIALGLFALIGLGLLLKDRIVLFVAGIAIAIDAIVFAFDIGGPETGLVVLLIMAGGLIAAATMLRRAKAASTPKA